MYYCLFTEYYFISTCLPIARSKENSPWKIPTSRKISLAQVPVDNPSSLPHVNLTSHAFFYLCYLFNFSFIGINLLVLFITILFI